MKSKAIHRVLEGIFLFTLILMIYVLSIFSAKGQMARELTMVPFELTSYSNELSFVEERIIQNSLNMSRATSDFNNSRKNDEILFTTNHTVDLNEIHKTKIELPKSDLRRKKTNEFQAPFLTIPLF